MVRRNGWHMASAAVAFLLSGSFMLGIGAAGAEDAPAAEEVYGAAPAADVVETADPAASVRSAGPFSASLPQDWYIENLQTMSDQGVASLRVRSIDYHAPYLYVQYYYMPADAWVQLEELLAAQSGEEDLEVVWGGDCTVAGTVLTAMQRDYKAGHPQVRMAGITDDGHVLAVQVYAEEGTAAPLDDPAVAAVLDGLTVDSAAVGLPGEGAYGNELFSLTIPQGWQAVNESLSYDADGMMESAQLRLSGDESDRTVWVQDFTRRGSVEYDPAWEAESWFGSSAYADFEPGAASIGGVDYQTLSRMVPYKEDLDYDFDAYASDYRYHFLHVDARSKVEVQTTARLYGEPNFDRMLPETGIGQILESLVFAPVSAKGTALEPTPAPEQDVAEPVSETAAESEPSADAAAQAVGEVIDGVYTCDYFSIPLPEGWVVDNAVPYDGDIAVTICPEDYSCIIDLYAYAREPLAVEQAVASYNDYFGEEYVSTFWVGDREWVLADAGRAFAGETGDGGHAYEMVASISDNVAMSVQCYGELDFDEAGIPAILATISPAQ